MDELADDGSFVDLGEELQLQQDRPAEQLVRELHHLLQEKISELQTYEVLSQSYEREMAQKELVIQGQATQLSRQSEQLLMLKLENNKIRLELEQLKSYLNFCRVKYESLAQQVAPLPPQLRSENRMKGFFKENRQYNQSRKSIETCESSEYVIERIKLRRHPRSSNDKSQRQHEEHEDESPLNQPGECLAEDFFVVGPDLNDISIEKMKDKGARQLLLKPTFLYQLHKDARLERCDKRRDILLRAFPNGIVVRKLENHEYGVSVRQVVEYLPSYGLHPDYFVFTLRGEDDIKSTLRLPVLDESNPSRRIFVLCLKLPDVVGVRSSNSSKHSPTEYWLTEKVYVVMSYYPLFDCHMRMLVELQRMNLITKLRCLQMDPGKSIGFGNMDVRDFTRTEAAGEFLRSYVSQRPNSTMDWIRIGQDNFASLPQKKDLKYLMAGFASGYVFQNICFEEFLVLLTAILSEKTVVFVSRSASLASFTALAFLGLISPFRYPHPIILNADDSKRDIIFQSPVPLLVSIATDKLDSILEQFLDANIENERSPFILVDLDSTSILLDKNVRNELLRIVPLPNEELKNRYLLHNKCRPRSVPLTKAMETAWGVLTTGGGKRHNVSRNEREERRKQLQREYKQQLDLNDSPRLLAVEPDYHLVRMVYQFVSTFAVKDVPKKFHRRDDLKDEILRIKRKLYEENVQQRPFLGAFMQTQIFNSHLDLKLEFG